MKPCANSILAKTNAKKTATSNQPSGGESPRNQNESESDMKHAQADYIKGFDAGYAYVLNEIEQYIKTYPSEEFVLKELLAHLKMEGKPQ